MAAESRFRRLGILGTRYPMEGPVDPARLADRGIAWELPSPADRESIHAIIFDEPVDRFRGEPRSVFPRVVEDPGRRGCDAVIPGCTEIPLLVSDSDSPLPTIDSTRTLARAALREAVR